MSVPEKRENTGQNKNRKTTLILGLIVVGMFGFGFAMVPLYRLVCNATGIGISGSSGTGRIVDSSTTKVQKDRWVTIQFDALLNENLRWDFYPEVKKINVHPGQSYEVSYYAKNKTDHKIVAKAVPGITPWQAATYFHKTECFCFTQQTMDAGEGRDMPLKFVIDPALPEDIKILTLSYTFMDTNRESIRDTREVELPVSVKHEG